MTSSCFSSVSELRIVWFLRNDFLKVECSKQESKSKEKRKQEWSYQQCNLVWYQSETNEILWDLFPPSTKLIRVLKLAWSNLDLQSIFCERSLWNDRSGKIFWARLIWEDRFCKLTLTRSFWQGRFGKIGMARSFWQDYSGKIVLVRSL